MKMDTKVIQAIKNRVFHPTYSWCLKCNRTWDVVEGHSTPYSESQGCFPLCEDCWKELKTPEARLPYYRNLVDGWKQLDNASYQAEDKWPSIKAAVMAGH